MTTITNVRARGVLQWFGDLKRLNLVRLLWERGMPGSPGGYSAKLALSIQFELRDTYIGFAYFADDDGWIGHLCLVPCVPIRIHFKRTYGGLYP